MAHLVTNYIISDFLDLFELNIGTDIDFENFTRFLIRVHSMGELIFEKKNFETHGIRKPLVMIPIFTKNISFEKN